MSMRIDWFGFAEAVANDARGMSTLVGFSPKLHVAESLPAPGQYSLVLEISDEEESEPELETGRTLVLDVSVSGPDGTLLLATQQTALIGEKKQPNVPSSVVVFIGTVLLFRHYGRHRAAVTVSIDGTDIRLEAHRDLHVVPE